VNVHCSATFTACIWRRRRPRRLATTPYRRSRSSTCSWRSTGCSVSSCLPCSSDKWVSTFHRNCNYRVQTQSLVRINVSFARIQREKSKANILQNVCIISIIRNVLRDSPPSIWKNVVMWPSPVNFSDSRSNQLDVADRGLCLLLELLQISWQPTNKNAIPSIFCDNYYCMTKSNSFLYESVNVGLLIRKDSRHFPSRRREPWSISQNDWSGDLLHEVAERAEGAAGQGSHVVHVQLGTFQDTRSVSYVATLSLVVCAFSVSINMQLTKANSELAVDTLLSWRTTLWLCCVKLSMQLAADRTFGWLTFAWRQVKR